MIDAAATINDEDLKVVRLLSKAGIPTQVLISKADLLNAEDLARVTEYVRTQIRSQLHLDLPVVPVSTVGEREDLLRSWFDHQIAPLREQNQSVLAKSLRQKTLLLRDSLLSALRFERQRRIGEPDIPENTDEMAIQLQSGDDAIRELQEFHFDVHANRGSYADRGAAAMDEALRHGDSASIALKNLAEKVMSEAAHDVLGRVEKCKARVVQAARNLDALRPSSGIDAASIESFPVSELPPFEFSLRHDIPVPGWWLALPKNLTRYLMSRRFNQVMGHEFSEAVTDYDRQLETWLHGKANALAAVDLQQTEATRTQLRASRGSSIERTPLEEGSIDADIRKLESADMSNG